MSSRAMQALAEVPSDPHFLEGGLIPFVIMGLGVKEHATVSTILDTEVPRIIYFVGDMGHLYCLKFTCVPISGVTNSVFL